MKPNVDLTLNQDFAKVETPTRSFRQILFPNSRFLSVHSIVKSPHRFPWTFQESFSYPDEGELILTGTMQERKEKKDWESYKKGEYCERCGKDLVNKPWDRHYTLCSACDEVLERNITIERDLVLREIMRG